MSKSRFQEVCPRRLMQLPSDGPCPLALRSVEMWQAGERDESKLPCAFFSLDPLSNYCFFKSLDDMNGHAAETSKEVAKVLGLTEKEATAALTSAIGKLKGLATRGEDSMALWVEAMADINTLPAEADIYAGEDWAMGADPQMMDHLAYKGEIERLLHEGKLKKEVAAALLKRGPGRPSAAIQPPKGFSGDHAMHKSGTKTQLWGLSANWHRVVAKFQEGPTPIRMTTNSLKSRAKRGDDSDEKDTETKTASD